MRCADIEIHAKIPVPVNSDGDNIYKAQCFKDEVGKAQNSYSVHQIERYIENQKNV